MPTAERFDRIYGAVTHDLSDYLDEELRDGRLNTYERDWFQRGLIQGFIDEYKTWSNPPNADIGSYLSRFERHPHSDLQLAAHVFLHVGYDLPRVLEDNLERLHPWVGAVRHRSDGDGFTEEQTARARAGYYACVSFIDEKVGEVLASLDDLGLAEDTVVIYSSDHGETMGAHDHRGVLTRGLEDASPV